MIHKATLAIPVQHIDFILDTIDPAAAVPSLWQRLSLLPRGLVRITQTEGLQLCKGFQVQICSRLGFDSVNAINGVAKTIMNPHSATVIANHLTLPSLKDRQSYTCKPCAAHWFHMIRNFEMYKSHNDNNYITSDKYVQKNQNLLAFVLIIYELECRTHEDISIEQL